MGAGKTVDQWDEWTAKTKEKHQNGNGHGPSLNIEMLRLLPTTTAHDWKGPNNGDSGSASTKSISTVIDNLLPTVTTQDAKNNGGPSQFDRNTLPLNTQVLESTSWGKFEPAIRRWEQVLGRPAPAPTKPDGKEGAHRLSSKFTEWMMGVPDGWITDCGLTRNEELKACGNGVVPQQAELALRLLLGDSNMTLEAGLEDNLLRTPTTMDVGRSTLSVERAKELNKQLSLGAQVKDIIKRERERERE
jgi:DNA (cytosine-5)-methyltransferase 1